jgi:hypothetical protein
MTGDHIIGQINYNGSRWDEEERQQGGGVMHGQK